MISLMEMFDEKFEIGDVFIPEVLLYARAMNEALPILEPYPASGKKEVTGRVLMGSVRRSHHGVPPQNLRILLLTTLMDFVGGYPAFLVNTPDALMGT